MPYSSSSKSYDILQFNIFLTYDLEIDSNAMHNFHPFAFIFHSMNSGNIEIKVGRLFCMGCYITNDPVYWFVGWAIS